MIMSLYKKLQAIYLILLSFMFVFAFPIVRPIYADLIASLFIYIWLVFDKDSFKYFFKLIRSKGFLYIFSTYLIFFILIISVTTFKEAYDFSMIKTLLHNIFSLFVCIALVSIVYSKYKIYEMSSLIVILLILQSVFMILMLILPDIRIIVQQHLLTSAQMERIITYGGVRGIALSNSIAFGIAVTMGMMGFVLHYWFLTVAKNISFVYKIIIFIITLIPSLAAGRSSILGFMLGFYLYIFNYSFFNQIKAFFKYFLMGMLIIVSLYIYISHNPELSYIFDKYIKYVFRAFINYLNYGSFSIHSVKRLEQMYFYPPNGNILFGDGFYTASNGDYYMKTDAGYMRFLLFFGVIGSFIIYFLFLFFIFFIKKRIIEKKFKYFLYGTILIFFIYQYKGDVIFWNIGLMKIFLLMVFFEYLKYLCYKDKIKGVK